MSHVPHELREDFPEYAEKITELKESNEHFHRLSEEYHTINREIHRVEIGEEHVSQADEEDMRKTRMRLKDELYAMLKAA